MACKNQKMLYYGHRKRYARPGTNGLIVKICGERMKRLVLLMSAIASINCGNAAGRMTDNVITVYAEDLVNNTHKDYSCRGGQWLKRYYDAEEFRKYIQTKWSSKDKFMILSEISHTGGEDNHPQRLTEVDLKIPGMIDGMQVMLGPKSVTKTNIRNLVLNIMLFEIGDKKVLLPPDSSGLFQNLDYLGYPNKSSIRLIDFIGASTESVCDMQEMFSGQNTLTFLNLRTFDTSNASNMSSMFHRIAKI